MPEYYVRRGDKTQGPAPQARLIEMAEAGKLLRTDVVATTTDGPWKLAGGEVWLFSKGNPVADAVDDVKLAPALPPDPIDENSKRMRAAWGLDKPEKLSSTGFTNLRIVASVMRIFGALSILGGFVIFFFSAAMREVFLGILYLIGGIVSGIWSLACGELIALAIGMARDVRRTRENSERS